MTNEVGQTVSICFAGDSGDGMQMMGQRFSSALTDSGHDVHTFPDFPAEIRAPQGSLSGVSGFEISFAYHTIYTVEDDIDVLVVMNPAALKIYQEKLKPNGTLLINEDAFTQKAWEKAGFPSDPLQLPELAGFSVIQAPMTSQTTKALESSGLPLSQTRKCKNMYALGIILWMYDETLSSTKNWIEDKFQATQSIAKANIKALEKGYNFADTLEIAIKTPSHVDASAKTCRTSSRQITGNEALVLAAKNIASQQNRRCLISSYPITPASSVLQYAKQLADEHLQSIQAEDEIAAAAMAIGASYAGNLGLTVTSGPGFDLMAEAIGYAVITEIPLVVVDVQRGGPSTGIPTKSEQTDLLMAIHGRHGEAPVPVLAPKTPSDCYAILFDAFSIACRYATPVVVLSEGSLAIGAEPWHEPDIAAQTPVERHAEYIIHPRAAPGTPDGMACLGGLEKDVTSGDINYTPQNHHTMVMKRKAKIDGVSEAFPLYEHIGKQKGKLLIISWGATYGPLRTVVEGLQAQGYSIALLHLRLVSPLPHGIDEIISQFDSVIVAETNTGQLLALIRAAFLVDAEGYNRITGKLFLIEETRQFFKSVLDNIT